jgi:hypothetical protein
MLTRRQKIANQAKMNKHNLTPWVAIGNGTHVAVCRACAFRIAVKSGGYNEQPDTKFASGPYNEECEAFKPEHGVRIITEITNLAGKTHTYLIKKDRTAIWSSPFDIPQVGDKVWVEAHPQGSYEVIGYFTESQYLGVVLRVAKNKTRLVFGMDVETEEQIRWREKA